MSLMGKCCCGGGGGCDTAPTCACLATSISIAIPAWTYIGASCSAQTVVAHLCCFTDGGNDYQVYRTTPILVYTDTLSLPGCSPDVSLPYYFVIYFLRGCSTCGPCEFEVQAGIVSSYYFNVNNIPEDICELCVTTPLTINSTTKCDGITTNNICGYSNTFISNSLLSFFTYCNPSTRCTLKLQTYYSASSLIVNSLSNNCDKPSSVTITFGTTPIVLTIT
jgi:hypothetical protein